MKKQFVVGLLSAGLVLAILPGVALAKGDAKWSECKKGGWTEWVRQDQTAFADQSECVAYVAEGGTLAKPTPPTFQSACVNLGGTYVAPYLIEYPWETLSYPEVCTALPEASWVTAQEVLGPFCTPLSFEATWDSSGPLVRCTPYGGEG
jgi:hypothetical protein